MAPLIRTRPTSFQPVCTFLYPRSCFTRKQTLAQAQQISTAKLHTRPLRLDTSSRHVCHQLSLSYRSFTTTSRTLRAGASPRIPKITSPAQKSYRVRVKEEIDKNGLPDDIGLFENTFIMPSGKSKPGIFSQPRLRAALEWYRLRYQALNLIRLIIYKFSFGKPRPQIQFRRTADIAKALHAKTFKAFAEGDMATLNSICTTNVLQHFARQIATRPRNTRYIWTVHRYLGRPRVLSRKAAVLTQGENATGQCQVVVKIRSVQSLVKVDAAADVNEKIEATARGVEDQQEKCEYFVIQQRTVQGVGPGEWRVWGTLSDKGWEEILERAGYTPTVDPAIEVASRK